MKKSSHSPLVFLALLLLSLSLALTLSAAKESIKRRAAITRETNESVAPVLDESGANFIWQSILHRF